MSLGKIESIENNSLNAVLIIGDFMADINKDFFRELELCAAASNWLYRTFNGSRRYTRPLEPRVPHKVSWLRSISYGSKNASGCTTNTINCNFGDLIEAVFFIHN